MKTARATAHFGEGRASSFRLPTDVQRDLEWFWCEAESEVGIRSNFGAVEDILRTGIVRGHNGGGVVPDAMPTGAAGARTRAARIWAILSRLKTGSEVLTPAEGARFERVLFRVYGPLIRSRLYGIFSEEFAPIAEYVSAADRAVEKWSKKSEYPVLVREAVELEVRNNPRVLARFNAQCDALLVGASRAFLRCASGVDKDLRATRAGRLDRIAAATQEREEREECGATRAA